MNIIAKTFAAAAFAGFAFSAPAQADYLANAPAVYQQETQAIASQSAGEWRATISAAQQGRRDDIKNRYNGSSQSSDGQGYIFN